MTAPLEDRETLRRWSATFLRAYPLAALLSYVLIYTYDFQYLAQFGVSPEEVGISELKLLSRAALYPLVLVAIYGWLAVVGSVVLVTREYRSERAMQLPRGARLRAWFGYLILLGAGVGALLVWGVAGAPGLAFALFTVPAAIAALLLIRRQSRALLATAFFAVTVCGALGYAAYFGGTFAGNATAKHGNVPALLGVFGVDVRQVKPTWLDPKAAPVHYKGQDLLDLGSEGGTIFLYDCPSQITRRVVLASVALDYSLTDIGGDRLEKRLQCG